MRRTGWLFLVLMLAACPPVCGTGGHSREVGGACQNDRDCVEECSDNPNFGDGMCTRKCDSDRDCPAGSVCVVDDILRNDGICAMECDRERDCDSFGRAYTCDDYPKLNGGSTEVCRLP